MAHESSYILGLDDALGDQETKMVEVVADVVYLLAYAVGQLGGAKLGVVLSELADEETTVGFVVAVLAHEIHQRLRVGLARLA